MIFVCSATHKTKVWFSVSTCKLVFLECLWFKLFVWVHFATCPFSILFAACFTRWDNCCQSKNCRCEMLPEYFSVMRNVYLLSQQKCTDFFCTYMFCFVSLVFCHLQQTKFPDFWLHIWHNFYPSLLISLNVVYKTHHFSSKSSVTISLISNCLYIICF